VCLVEYASLQPPAALPAALAPHALPHTPQACLPSPFFFFDEIDAALDSCHAGRVADYIMAHCGLPAGQAAAAAALAPPSSVEAAAAPPPPPPATAGGQPAVLGGLGGQPAVLGGLGGQPAVPSGLGGQYLVVSHRLQVYERAACLLGVYSLPCGASGAAVLRI
jgi:hypothetical protein